jgi:23S rRNA A1618 N6-methylase RlmF
MAQGQKSSRVVAWSFLPQSAHEEWARQRWSETA